MNSIKTGWYAIYTRPRHEKKVVEQLDYLQMQHFLPTMKTLRVWSGRRKYVQLPLFPSYVFVKLENIQHYFESLQIPGVINYVRTGNQIAGVSDSIMHKLQAATGNEEQEVEVSAERFGPGSILTINAGPFTGFSCEIIQYRGKYKILVRIELLQRNILVDLPACLLSSGLSAS